MSDDEIIRFLMAMTIHVAQIHARHTTKKETNAGPRFSDDSIPIEPEGFARWMGWRGPEEQEREMQNQKGI